MKTARYALSVIAMGLMTGSALGNISVSQSSQIAGVLTNEFYWSSANDWTSAGMFIDLTTGSIYNELALGNPQDVANPAIWGFVPTLQWETWVGPSNAGLAGGCGDCGGPAQTFGPSQLSVSWFNTAADDFDTQIASVALTNDAQGQFVIITAGVRYEGVITDGLIWPEPTSALLLGLGGLAVLRRR